MDFLKNIIDNETYSKLEEAINTKNATITDDKLKIKLVNLGSGQFTDVNKVTKSEGVLNAKIEALETENKNLNNTIKEYQTTIKKHEAAFTENTELKEKLTTIQNEFANNTKDLQTQLANQKIETYTKDLIEKSGGDKDVIYAILKGNSEFEKISIDKEGNVIGADTVIGLYKSNDTYAKYFTNGTEIPLEKQSVAPNTNVKPTEFKTAEDIANDLEAANEKIMADYNTKYGRR